MTEEKTSRARKISKVPTKNYDYGVLWLVAKEGRRYGRNVEKPTIKPEQDLLVRDLLWKSNRLRNQLVRIERNRRARIRRIMKIVAPELETLEREYEALEDQYSKVVEEKISGIKKKERPAEVTAELREIQERKKAVAKAIKETRQKAHKEHFERLNERLTYLISRERLKVLVDKKLIEPELLDDPPAGISPEALEAREARIRAATSARPSPDFPQPLLGPNHNERHAAKRRALDALFKEEPKARAWQILQEVKRIADLRGKYRKEHSGLGNKAWVAEAAEASFAKTIFMPKFVPYDGTGIIPVQLTEDKGLTLKRALSGQDPWLKITLHPDVPLRKKRGAMVAATVQLKLFGTKKNAVFLDLPTVIHRELPEDSVIKWAKLKVCRIGSRFYYRLLLTIESETFLIKKAAACQGHIAVNVGWRRLPNNDLRVATTWDGQKHSFLVLPAKMFEKERKKEHLLAVNDDIFNAEKRWLVAWIKQHGISRTLRDCLVKAPHHLWHLDANDNEAVASLTDKAFKTKVIRAISAWRNHKKLAKVAWLLREAFLPAFTEIEKRWREHRLPRRTMPHNAWKESGEKPDLFPTQTEGVGDDRKIYIDFTTVRDWLIEQGVTDDLQQLAMQLNLWVSKDPHLNDWARNKEAHLKLERREIYRRFTFHLSNTYRHVVVEKWNKSETAKLPAIENDKRSQQEEEANSLRHFASVSTLTEALQNRFGKEFFHKAPAHNITIRHFGCGGTGKGVMQSTEVTCSKCRLHYDQDVNAAKHLWERFERFGEPEHEEVAAE